MALGPYEQHRLDELASLTRAEDPDFAVGLSSGQPFPPAEYRRRFTRLRIAFAFAASGLAVAAFLAGMPGGGFMAALGALLALVTVREGFFGPPPTQPPAGGFADRAP